MFGRGIPTMHMHQVEPEFTYIHVAGNMFLISTNATASLQPLSCKIHMTTMHLITANFEAEVAKLLAVTRGQSSRRSFSKRSVKMFCEL